MSLSLHQLEQICETINTLPRFDMVCRNWEMNLEKRDDGEYISLEDLAEAFGLEADANMKLSP